MEMSQLSGHVMHVRAEAELSKWRPSERKFKIQMAKLSGVLEAAVQ
jgi:hypothetical protein